MDDDLFYWMALNFVPGLGSVLIKRLLEQFKTPQAIFNAPIKELMEIEGLSEKIANEIHKGPPVEKVYRELSLLKRVGGKVVPLNHEIYPQRLKEIYDPPPLLYMRGEIKKEDDLAVAIVGSRRTTPYGRWVTEKISQELASQGITVISGMARGIDSVAHLGALSVRGRTIAVLGCGVDRIYPSENRVLFNRIIDQGAVLSEFPMGSPPEGSHFPKRNRIISGLSLGVVVVEAGEESGSLITAHYALEQGREVFAVPGNIGAKGSKGTHQLLRQGAKLVESSEDILEEILPQWKREKRKVEGEELQGLELNPEERKVYDTIGEDPLHIDFIIKESGLDPGKVSSLLLDLELKGLIIQWPGKCFSKKR
ncbi:MAG: DNA-processing protein DprA [Thermodesulfobacteriota bacterium]